jgi:N-acetylglucosamine kinase-like BadF-type ATPase
MANYVIGIDAGATKTQLVIADEDGEFLANEKGGPANLHTVEKADIKQHLSAVYQTARRSAGVEGVPKAVCIGVSGLDAPDDRELIEDILANVFPRVSEDKRIAVNDIVIARRSNSDKPYGVALISGTGSNGYGVNKSGQEAFVGGLDWLLTDDGSGFQVGMRSLRAAVKSEDGRRASKLEELVKGRLKVDSMRELVPGIYKKFEKSYIASFAPLVDTAKADGDKVAKEILDAACDDLFEMLEALMKRLKLKNTACDLVLVGGQINQSEYLSKQFNKRVKKTFKKLKVKKASSPPVKGAVKIALEEV